MAFKVILSNKAHPEYGEATIPLPIPDDQYDSTIELLNGLDIGDATAQDCHVDATLFSIPILNRLTGQTVNVDELDYLAKRLDGFCNGEGGKFEAMAVKLGLSSIRDYINLTFFCQQATVIADFSDLEHVGKDHALTMSGGSMLSEEYDQVDGRMAALDLLQNHSGTITPYGVVYDNGMKLEPLYDGRHFPAYLYKPSLMVLEVDPDPAGTAAGYLYLPCPARQLQRTLLRARQDPAGFRLEVTIDELPTEVSSLVSPTRDSLDALNALCQAVEPLNTEERRKLEAVVLMTHPQCAGEVRQLAENLDQFEFAPDVQTLEDYGRFMIQESGHFEYDENLERFYDYRLYGEIHSREDGGVFTKLGYVAYHGSLTLEELMMDDPAELYQQEMGGMA